MKINAQKILRTLNREIIKDQDGTLYTIGKAIAQILIQPGADRKGMNPLKAYLLAQKFYDEKEVELDEADAAQVKEIVEKSVAFSPIILGQILEIMK